MSRSHQSRHPTCQNARLRSNRHQPKVPRKPRHCWLSALGRAA